MSDRTYTFTFDGDDMHMESSDGLLDEAQAKNILALLAMEIKPHAPQAALAEMVFDVQKALTERGNDE